jgi:hypothetical protein
MSNPYRGTPDDLRTTAAANEYARTWTKRRVLLTSLLTQPILMFGALVGGLADALSGPIVAFVLLTGLVVSTVSLLLLLQLRCPRCGRRFVRLNPLVGPLSVLRSACRHCGQPAGRGDPLRTFLVQLGLKPHVYLLSDGEPFSYFVVHVPWRGEVLPIWSTVKGIRKARRGSRRRFAIVAISLGDFCREVLPLAERYGTNIGLDWNGSDHSIPNVSPLRFGQLVVDGSAWSNAKW